jgi:hypothetical protein
MDQGMHMVGHYYESVSFVVVELLTFCESTPLPIEQSRAGEDTSDRCARCPSGDPSQRKLGHRPACLAGQRTRAAGHHAGSRSPISLQNRGTRGANALNHLEIASLSARRISQKKRSRRRESLDAAHARVRAPQLKLALMERAPGLRTAEDTRNRPTDGVFNRVMTTCVAVL